MKTMTCNQFGGACDHKLTAETFEEMAELSKNHGMEMFQKGDKPHLEAMKKMQTLNTGQDAMMKWMEEKKALYNATPEDGA